VKRGIPYPNRSASLGFHSNFLPKLQSVRYTARTLLPSNLGIDGVTCGRPSAWRSQARTVRPEWGESAATPISHSLTLSTPWLRKSWQPRFSYLRRIGLAVPEYIRGSFVPLSPASLPRAQQAHE
jgi:hypothetical protein